MKRYDLQVVTFRNKVIIAVQSATGMFWVQCHFEEKDWHRLSEGSFLLSRVEGAMMVEDAIAGGLEINYD